MKLGSDCNIRLFLTDYYIANKNITSNKMPQPLRLKQYDYIIASSSTINH